MPDNDGPDSNEWRREPKMRNSWYSKTKNLFLKAWEIFGVGQNAIVSKDHSTAHNWVDLGQSSTPYVEQPEAIEPDQHRLHQIPLAQDTHGSRDEVAQIASVGEPPTSLQTNNILSTLPSDSGSTTQSEVTVIYADSDYPLDSVVTYSQTSRSRPQIYHLDMLTHKAGYPLYIPTPPEGLPPSHRENGVRVGDVGVITANGAFHFLFNVFQEQSDAENCLPIDSFKWPKPKVMTRDQFGPNSYLSSASVNNISNRDSRSIFQCSSDAGVVLALPEGATVYEAENRAILQMHASRHALDWYKYVLNHGIDVSNGSVYFVTECTKSMNWGIAVFYARSTTYHSLQLVYDGESYEWDYRGKVEARTGSKLTDISVSDGGEPNQCVFLGGYKIMLRPDIWNKLKSDAMASSQGGGLPSPQILRTSHYTNHGASGSRADPYRQSTSNNRNTLGPIHTRLQADQPTHTQVLEGGSAKTDETTNQVGPVILEDFFHEPTPLHPSDLINEMLLHLRPEATVALTHDSVWCNHLPDDFNADPTTPSFDGLLENIERSYKAVIDEDGSVVLENNLELRSEVQHVHDSPASNTTFTQASQTSAPSITLSSPIMDSRSLVSQLSDAFAETLVPTTDEDYPRFRILVMGRSGAGKSSLINTIFKAPLADDKLDKAGLVDIYNGITSPHNEHLILHDSGGYEPGEDDKFRILERFITEQTQKQSPTERLHAIWLCIPVPASGGPLFESGEEKIFKLNRNKVPLIIVFTKFDLYIADMERRTRMENKISYQSAEDYFKEEFIHIFDKNGIGGEQIPYALMSESQSDTLQRLVQITRKSMRTEAPGPSSRGSDEDRSVSAYIALATAQRVDMAGKIEASIKVWNKKYLTAMGTPTHFSGMNLEECLKMMHNDVITIWNIRDLHDYFFGDTFHRRMMVIVEDLQDAASTVDLRCLMGYVVDLTLILQAIFQVSLRDQIDGKVTLDNIDEIIYEFHCSEKKKNIHYAIRTFPVEAQYPFAKSNVASEMASLIQENEMTLNDTKLDKERPALRSLLLILRFEPTANGPIVNQTTLGLVCELLILPDYPGVVADLDPSDVEVLLDFLLQVLRNDSLSTSGIPDANRKARRLMFELISEQSVVPSSLYITDVRMDMDLYAIDGSYGHIFKGQYQGKAVALKVIEKAHKDINCEFCWEALAWRSLSHPSILTLLGIFKGKSQLFYVSPYMENGTLSDWRARNEPPDLSEIHRLMLEVAEGVWYIHSEGIVHGNLKGDKILLDSDLHCRIADFGLTRHSDATATGSMVFSPHFAAPELFGKCIECAKYDCDECLLGHVIQRRKTMEADVYAFSSLYYSIFFNTVPFGGIDSYHIGSLVINGGRPARLENPKMEDNTWNLLESCWKHEPSERPEAEQVVSSIALGLGWHSVPSNQTA